MEGNVERRHLAKYNNEVLEEKRLKFLYEKFIVAFVGTGRRLVQRRRQLLLLATSRIRIRTRTRSRTRARARMKDKGQ